MNQAINIGVHPLDTARNDIVLDLAAYSPVTHGMPQIRATVTDGVIHDAQVVLGSMHRGVEKLFESRDYRQILMLANRHEWLSPITGEVGLAELLEKALGIAVPEQAVQLRKALIAYSRITSHLAFLAGFPFSEDELVGSLRQHREQLIAHQQEFIGNRMHPMITRIGGFTHSPSSQWLSETQKVISATSALAQNVADYAATQSQWDELGVFAQADIDQYGITGPASTPGGVTQRICSLVSQIHIAVQELDVLIPPLIAHIDEPINVLLPKVPRIPEGEYTHTMPTPLGQAIWFMVSRGDKMPYRLKLRPASLHTMLALGPALEGVKLENAKYVVASMPFVTGDAER